MSRHDTSDTPRFPPGRRLRAFVLFVLALLAALAYALVFGGPSAAGASSAEPGAVTRDATPDAEPPPGPRDAGRPPPRRPPSPPEPRPPVPL